jgi:hypothetical protein
VRAKLFKPQRKLMATGGDFSVHLCRALFIFSGAQRMGAAPAPERNCTGGN